MLSNPELVMPLRPSLLIIALSTPSLYVFHYAPSKVLIGRVVVPEIPLSGNSVEPSLRDKSCNVYALNDDNNFILLISVQCSVSGERSNLVAKLLIGEQIIPERVLILDSIQSQNFRGKLSPDETFAFKLETSAEKKWLNEGVGGSSLLKGFDYFPSGSLVDGLAAALLAPSQMRNIRGALCVSWPAYGGVAVALVKDLLQKNILPGFDLRSCGDAEDKLRLGQIKNRPFNSDLYT